MKRLTSVVWQRCELTDLMEDSGQIFQNSPWLGDLLSRLAVWASCGVVGEGVETCLGLLVPGSQGEVALRRASIAWLHRSSALRSLWLQLWIAPVSCFAVFPGLGFLCSQHP